MSRAGSYAFRPGQPGSILDTTQDAGHRLTEPTAQERERAMGYLPGSTAAEGVSEEERCRAIGQGMDANSLQLILATTEAYWLVNRRDAARAGKAVFVALEPIKQQCQMLEILTVQQPFSTQRAICMAAAGEELAGTGGKASGDVWKDQTVLDLLNTGKTAQPVDATELRRAQKRARSYYLVGEQLIRRMPDGTEKAVPPPASRQQLIQQQHEKCGHYGARRTAAMLLTKYWWYGLLADVSTLVRHCEQCSRIQASFTAKPEQLQSIPISGLGYRWHVDLAGPFPVSRRGHAYVMIAVEAFTKHLEAVPIKNKEAATVAYAFLHNVVAEFGAPGQVVTDSGTEFEGKFAQLLQDCMIDHAVISKDHPQANGQAEKMVQTVEKALMKMVASHQAVSTWDEDVAWVSMGYRCSPQRSTGFSPYELLYARKPVVPPAAAEILIPDVDYDNPAAAAQDLVTRKNKLKLHVPAAMENLAIAQHRDQLRYLQSRDPTYKPKLKHFHVGDFVHVQQLQRNSTLQPRAQPVIYRVTEVKDTGVLLLQGKCGRTVSMHMSHCAPCHLPGIDSSIDPRLAEDTEEAVCEICGTDEQEDKLLLCDLCTLGFHTFCLRPALTSVPGGVWLCPICVQQGFTVADAEERAQKRQELLERDAGPVIFPNAAMKRRDQDAAGKDGKLVQKVFFDPSSGQPRPYWGRVHFKGPLARPDYYLVMWEDGEQWECGNRQLNPLLQPEGTGLPAGLVIPAPPADFVVAAAQVFQPETVQQVIRDRDQPLPSHPVPKRDLMLLSSKLLWQHCSDPVTHYGGWMELPFSHPKPNESWPANQPVPQGLPIFIAPALQYVLQALHRALKLRPTLVICYIPALWIPTAVWQLAKTWIAQGSGALFRVEAGCASTGSLASRQETSEERLSFGTPSGGWPSQRTVEAEASPSDSMTSEHAPITDQQLENAGEVEQAVSQAGGGNPGADAGKPEGEGLVPAPEGQGSDSAALAAGQQEVQPEVQPVPGSAGEIDLAAAAAAAEAGRKQEKQRRKKEKEKEKGKQKGSAAASAQPAQELPTDMNGKPLVNVPTGEMHTRVAISTSRYNFHQLSMGIEPFILAALERERAEGEKSSAQLRHIIEQLEENIGLIKGQKEGNQEAVTALQQQTSELGEQLAAAQTEAAALRQQLQEAQEASLNPGSMTTEAYRDSLLQWCKDNVPAEFVEGQNSLTGVIKGLVEALRQQARSAADLAVSRELAAPAADSKLSERLTKLQEKLDSQAQHIQSLDSTIIKRNKAIEKLTEERDGWEKTAQRLQTEAAAQRLDSQRQAGTWRPADVGWRNQQGRQHQQSGGFNRPRSPIQQQSYQQGALRSVAHVQSPGGKATEPLPQPFSAAVPEDTGRWPGSYRDRSRERERSRERRRSREGDRSRQRRGSQDRGRSKDGRRSSKRDRSPARGRAEVKESPKAAGRSEASKSPEYFSSGSSAEARRAKRPAQERKARERQ
eukprot:gene616-biopygen1270